MEPRWIDVTFINLIVDNRLVTLCLPCVAFSPSRPHKSHRPCYSTRKQNCNSIRTRSPWLSGNSKDNPFSSRCGIYAIQMVAQAGSASAKDRYRINPLERQMSRIPFSPFSWVRGLILRNAILKVTLDWKGISRRPRPFCREGLGDGQGQMGPYMRGGKLTSLHSVNEAGAQKPPPPQRSGDLASPGCYFVSTGVEPLVSTPLCIP